MKYQGEQAMTMAEAIRKFLEKSGGRFTSDEVKQAINADYPGKWKPATLQAHLYACSVNNPKAYIHHPFAVKFLYKNSDGSFELYDEERHGVNEWVPAEGEEQTSPMSEMVETSIGLERDIEDHLINNLASIEKGLKFVSRQFHTDIGRIDILAEDAKGERVVIEVKVGEAKDSVIGQIARYLGWFTKTDGKPPRGIVVASDFPEGVRYAASIIPGLKLISYRVHFSFEDSSL
jgi:RecB family endonuclease NucS